MSKLWKEYFEQTKNDPPRPLLIKALSFVKERNNVLDLGAGALNDSIYLLGEGFKHVTAVDKEPMALEIAKNLPSDKFEYVIKSFETFEFPKEKFDLINAQCSLPFISPKKLYCFLFLKTKAPRPSSKSMYGQDTYKTIVATSTANCKDNSPAILQRICSSRYN